MPTPEFLTDVEQINQFLQDYCTITGTVTILPDGQVNIAGSCTVSPLPGYFHYTQLPVKFANCDVNFIISQCYSLQNLKGCPDRCHYFSIQGAVTKRGPVIQDLTGIPQQTNCIVIADYGITEINLKNIRSSTIQITSCPDLERVFMDGDCHTLSIADCTNLTELVVPKPPAILMLEYTGLHELTAEQLPTQHLILEDTHTVTTDIEGARKAIRQEMEVAWEGDSAIWNMVSAYYNTGDLLTAMTDFHALFAEPLTLLDATENVAQPEVPDSNLEM